MKNRIALLALALTLAASAAQAQQTYPISLPKGVTSIAQSIIEDADPAFICKYLGTSPCASIAIAAGGDMTFTAGTCGAESAATDLECDASIAATGSRSGVYDLSSPAAACDTVGEIIDLINSQSSNWQCEPYAALRADATDDKFLTISATQATGPGGLKIYFDSSTFLSSTVVLAPPGKADYRSLSLGPTSEAFKTKPWAGTQAILSAASTVSTYGSGTSTFTISAVDRTFGTTGADVVTTLWGPVTNGLTTAVKIFGSCDTPATACSPEWGPGGLICPPDQQCILRVTNSAALASDVINVNGLFFNVPSGGIGGVQ